MTTALARLGSQHVAEPLGWIETTLDGVPTSLAILPGTCGWPPTAGRSPRRACVTCTRWRTARATAAGRGGRRRLRRRGVPARHRHRPGTRRPGRRVRHRRARRRTRCGELTEQMFRKLDLAEAAVPELGRYSEMIGDAYSEPGQAAGPDPGAARARRLPPGPGDAHRRPAGWCSTSRASRPPRSRSAAPAPPRCATWPGCSAPSTTRPGTSSSATRSSSASTRSPATGCGGTRAPSAPGTRKRAASDPDEQRRPAARAAAGQGSVRSAVRGKAPAVLAADSA